MSLCRHEITISLKIKPKKENVISTYLQKRCRYVPVLYRTIGTVQYSNKSKHRTSLQPCEYHTFQIISMKTSEVCSAIAHSTVQSIATV